MDNLAPLFTWMQSLRPDVNNMLIITDDCCHLSSFWVKIFGVNVQVKKDPAHLSFLIFRSFVKHYGDRSFLQMVKNE